MPVKGRAKTAEEGRGGARGNFIRCSDGRRWAEKGTIFTPGGDRPAPARPPPTPPVRAERPRCRRRGGRGAVPAAGAEGAVPHRHLPPGAPRSARSCSRQRPWSRSSASVSAAGAGREEPPALPGPSPRPAPPGLSTGSFYSSIPSSFSWGTTSRGPADTCWGFTPMSETCGLAQTSSARLRVVCLKREVSQGSRFSPGKKLRPTGGMSCLNEEPLVW